MPFRRSSISLLLLLPALFVLFTAFTCDDEDFRAYAPDNTFLIGYGGGNCAGFCTTIFKVQDSVLFFYEPGNAPGLGPGSANLDGWQVMGNQSQLIDVFALQYALPAELMNSSTDRFGCPGCADGPYAQVSLHEDEFGSARTWYINANPLDGSVISDELREYAIAIQELVADLDN